MTQNWILGLLYINNLFGSCLVYMLVCFGVFSSLCGQVLGDGSQNNNTFTISSFAYENSELKPYGWRYIRVELPTWFSSVSIVLESDVDFVPKNILKASRSSLPMICFREGSPPLPDVYNTSLTNQVFDNVSNDSFGGFHGLQIVDQCYPMQKMLSVKWTIEQISPGTWYIGLFNGIGAVRTQSKMINRGRSYFFSGNISVEGCNIPLMSGQYCNQTVQPLSCTDISNYSDNAENIVSCGTDTCFVGDEKPNLFSLNIVGMSEKLILKASNVSNGIVLMAYACHGAIPSRALYDYMGNVTEAPFVIEFPKLGNWFVMIQPVFSPNQNGGKVCYWLEWQVIKCPLGMIGPNCTFNTYMLQAVLRRNPLLPFEAFYTPMTKVSDSASFPLEPLLSNTSYADNPTFSWTFFIVDIPFGAAGGNIHIQLVSDEKIDYGVYARYGGFPSVNIWDYYVSNSSSNSNGSMFFKMYDSSEKSTNFYVLYAREGTWCFGLRHLSLDGHLYDRHTTMSISLERCPQKCSSHGTCAHLLDTSGLTFYSYCDCDRNHGGFDCGIEIVSQKGHIWQSIALIASNAAAILPAYWAIRHKAFAEWVLYTSSGISSGLYHACDVGTWCVLPFHVLQFMDFWLSFMAVVTTFIYLAAIDETSKRTIHTVAAILTALMAENGPTRSSNIVLVISIGALGLMTGWLIELCTHFRSSSYRLNFTFNMVYRWTRIGEWLMKLIRMFLIRYRWGFLLAGLVAFAMAVISWTFETTQNYWIWHSLWHVSIYTSSFLFLCSKSKVLNCDEDEGRSPDGVPDEHYSLARQDSSSGPHQI